QGIHYLLRCKSAHAGVRAGKGAVFEHGVIKEIGGSHGRFDTPIADGLLEIAQKLVALGRGSIEGDHIVVVKLEAVAIALGQAADALESAELGTSLVAERIPATILKTPDAEGKLVKLCGSVRGGRHSSPFLLLATAGSSRGLGLKPAIQRAA